jgi:S-layer homology domain
MHTFKVRLLSLLAVSCMVAPMPAWSARFVDTSSSWTEKYINQLSDKGIIPSTQDGQFYPNKPITRAQLSAWLVKVLGIENQQTPDTSGFPDVKPSDWFFKPVEIIRQNNYISGYADGFRPNQFMQQAEVLTIIARTLNLPDLDAEKATAELSQFSDADKVPGWARQGVAQACAAGIYVNGQDEHKLNPTALATRGQTAAFLSKLDEHQGRELVAQVDKRAEQPNADTSVAATSQVATQPADASAAALPAAQSPMNAQVSREMFSPPTQQAPSQPAPEQTSNLPAPVPPPPMQGQANQAPVAYAPPQYLPQQTQSAPAPNSYTATQPLPYHLQGALATVAAGTDLRAHLATSLDSATSRVGDPVTATVYEPIYVNGQVALPSGSRFTGTVSYVRSAKHFRAGQYGKIAVKFVFVETPDGRRFPINGSIDDRKAKMAGGTPIGRVGKELAATGIGAGGGALTGTAVGAVAGLIDHNMGGSILAGALIGTTIGGTTGAIVGVVCKGQDISIPVGTTLPIKLEDPLTITPASMAEPAYAGQPSLPAYMPAQSAAYTPQNGYHQ